MEWWGLLGTSGEVVWKTVWPSGLRRLTWNQLSSGCVGSNPATVVFSKNIYVSWKSCVSCKYRISYIEVCICICIFSILPFIYPVSIVEDNVAEWLRRLPAKQFPFGSVGSNPAVVVFWIVFLMGNLISSIFSIFISFGSMVSKIKKMEVRGIDPRAPRMQSECSTIWATPPYKQKGRCSVCTVISRLALGFS